MVSIKLWNPNLGMDRPWLHAMVHRPNCPSVLSRRTNNGWHQSDNEDTADLELPRIGYERIFRCRKCMSEYPDRHIPQ